MIIYYLKQSKALKFHVGVGRVCVSMWGLGLGQLDLEMSKSKGKVQILQFKSKIVMFKSFSRFALVALLVMLSIGKIVQVPPISSDDSLTLRLDQSSSIDSAFSPFGNLTRVYKKQVFEIIDGKQSEFSTCTQQAPWADFWGQAFMSISNSIYNYGLVYNFQQIKYPRSLIDLTTHGNKVYYMLEKGEIKINTITSDYRSIKEHVTHQTNESKVAKGNFVILPAINSGLFINHNQVQLFNLEDDTFNAVVQYETRKDFESAIVLDNNYFAAAFGQEGLRIYSVSPKDSTLKVEAELNKDNSNLDAINIKDLAYDSNRKILFIADYNAGVLSLQLIFGSQGLQTKLTSSSIPNKLCNLIYYDSFNDELYLNCRKLMKYRINNWPIIDEKVLPRQEISIREIISTQSVVALVGREIFQIIIADRKASIYEDKLLDKLVLQDGHFISGNENGILIGSYTLNPPRLTCSPFEKSLIGTHRLVLKVTAECNKNFFSSVGFQPGTLAHDDKCVYTVYKNMVVWQPATINTTPFMVIGILLGLIGVGILIWLALSYLNFRKLKNYFDNYQNLEEEGHKGMDTDEEKHDGGSNPVLQPNAYAETGEKLENPAKKEEMELQSGQLHDIQ